MSLTVQQIKVVAKATLNERFYAMFEREAKQLSDERYTKLLALTVRRRALMDQGQRLGAVFAATSDDERQIRYECRVAMMQSYARIYAQQQENSP